MKAEILQIGFTVFIRDFFSVERSRSLVFPFLESCMNLANSMGITGKIVHKGGVVICFIEGDSDSVNKFYEMMLAGDELSDEFQLFYIKTCNEREYSRFGYFNQGDQHDIAFVNFSLKVNNVKEMQLRSNEEIKECFVEFLDEYNQAIESLDFTNYGENKSLLN